MHFIAEIINSADQQSIHTINEKLPDIVDAVKTCHQQVLKFVEEVYVTFAERPKQNKALSQKCTELQQEVTELKNELETVIRKNVQDTRNELNKDLKTLQQTAITVDFVKKINDLHQAFCDIKELESLASYVECIYKIKEAEEWLEALRQDKDLPIFEAFQDKLGVKKVGLFHNLTSEFESNVTLIKQEALHEIRIKNTDTLMEVISALYHFSPSVVCLDKITKFLWENVFVPIVDFTTIIECSIEDDTTILRVKILDPALKAPYIAVFENLKTVLNFLAVNFCFGITEADDLTTLKYIGRDIRDNLSELIIKHCLEDTIPANEDSLKQYHTVIKATEDLERSLIEADIFDSDTTSILEYANNVNVLFINKKCREYLTLSEPLMKKDLHDLVEVGSQDIQIFEVDSNIPKCSISKGLLELVQFLENILHEATKKSDLCAGRLFHTVQNICIKYTVFVPEHHKKFLQTIPQQIAVFYSNCYYFAHKLTEWNDLYVSQLSEILRTPATNFASEIMTLQKVGSQMFDTYVDAQIKQMLETMKAAGLEGKKTLHDLDETTEKCLRQCLRQQELLKTVWSKVLPYSTYNQTLGKMLNSLCNYVVNSVLKFEDISSDAAQQLVELLKMMQTRGPKVFTDPKEINLFVESWYKLNELMFVLNASLLDINDRWADGKGPLALQFKPEELKQLVRALFQNTERRATLLEKIHL